MFCERDEGDNAEEQKAQLTHVHLQLLLAIGGWYLTGDFVLYYEYQPSAQPLSPYCFPHNHFTMDAFHYFYHHGKLNVYSCIDETLRTEAFLRLLLTQRTNWFGSPLMRYGKMKNSIEEVLSSSVL